MHSVTSPTQTPSSPALGCPNLWGLWGQVTAVCVPLCAEDMLQMLVQRLKGGSPTAELPFGSLVTPPRELNITVVLNTKTTGWKTWQWTMARKWFSEDGKCNSNKMPKVMLNYRPIGQIQLGRPLKRVFDTETGLLWPNSWQMMMMMMLTASGYSEFDYCGTWPSIGCWQIRSGLELYVTWSVGRLNVMTAKFKR